YLEGTSITSLPDNLTVGGSLYLEGTSITSLPDNLTVGGSLDLEGTSITDTSKVNRKAPLLLKWIDGKFIKIDGIFSEVLSHRGNIYRTKQIGNSEISYLVTDGNGKWSHGKTLKDAKSDLIFKIADRDKSRYEYLTLDSILTYEEAIECYRVITGACAYGTKMFVEGNSDVVKEHYSIKEMIELTNSQYGGIIFKEFFLK
ncbi:MAG: hypothetical protein ACRCZY_02775, partial [Phocaeicola sp.]